jgi:RNA polymerase-associated protein
VLTIYDAARCPYCARVRILLAEKDIPHELVSVNLDDRPRFVVELNPPNGRVPILEEDAFVLPESEVVNEYLEERYPDPPLLPADPADRARARLLVRRFDDLLGDAYYDLYFKRPAGSNDRMHAALLDLDGRLDDASFLAGDEYTLADIAYVPWLLRVEWRLGVELTPYPAITAWVERLCERPAVAAERDVVATLSR